MAKNKKVAKEKGTPEKKNPVKKKTNPVKIEEPLLRQMEESMQIIEELEKEKKKLEKESKKLEKEREKLTKENQKYVTKIINMCRFKSAEEIRTDLQYYSVSELSVLYNAIPFDQATIKLKKAIKDLIQGKSKPIFYA